MRRGMLIGLKVTVVIIAMVTIMLCMLALPTVAKQAAKTNPEYAHLRYPILIGIYLTVVPFFVALYQSLKLLKFIEHHRAFTDMTMRSLIRIKQCAIVIMALYVIGMVVLIFENALHPGIALLGFGVVFASFVVLLFASVLRELLKNVIKIKLENDLTI